MGDSRDRAQCARIRRSGILARPHLGADEFLVYLGMRNYDLKDRARGPGAAFARLLMKSWQSDRAIYENYNANTGAGNDVRSSDGYYHWGALLGVIGLMEH
jgi:putative isomerase